MSQTTDFSTTINVIRSMRAQIDTFINTAKHFTEHFGKRSREMSLAHTELQRAKHLLGLHLGFIGSENPYPNSMDSTNQIIDKQAEHNDVSLFPTFTNRNCDTDIKAVKEFRKILQDFLDNNYNNELFFSATFVVPKKNSILCQTRYT